MIPKSSSDVYSVILFTFPQVESIFVRQFKNSFSFFFSSVLEDACAHGVGAGRVRKHLSWGMSMPQFHFSF